VRHGRVLVAAVLAVVGLQGFAIAGEFVMKSGKGYGVCEALKKNLAAYKHDRAQLCERKIHPSVKGLKVLAGRPLDPSQYVEFLIEQLNTPEQEVGRRFDRDGARAILKEAIREKRVRMEMIDADIDNNGKPEKWFWYYKENPSESVDSRCNVSQATSMVFLMNEAGTAFDYERMRGLSRNGTRIVQYGKRTYVEKEFMPEAFGVYQEAASGFIPMCVFSYQPLSDLGIK